MNVKNILMGIALGMVGAYALGVASRKFGPFPGLGA
jgi:hypothetical protein